MITSLLIRDLLQNPPMVFKVQPLNLRCHPQQEGYQITQTRRNSMMNLMTSILTLNLEAKVQNQLEVFQAHINRILQSKALVEWDLEHNKIRQLRRKKRREMTTGMNGQVTTIDL